NLINSTFTEPVGSTSGVRGWRSTQACNSASCSGANVSTGTAGAAVALWLALTACSRGNASTSPADATSHTTTIATPAGLRFNAPISRCQPDCSARSGPAAAADNKKMPITLTYIVRQSGQA